MADIQDEVALINRLSGQTIQAIDAKSIAEKSELRTSDADDLAATPTPPVIKPPRKPRKKAKA